MAPWRKACLRLAGLAILFGLMSLLLRDQEPRYRHVPLSQWLVLDTAYKHGLRREGYVNAVRLTRPHPFVCEPLT